MNKDRLFIVKYLKYILYSVLLAALFCVNCAQAGKAAVDTGQLKQEIRNSAMPFLLDIREWQIQNLSRPLGNNRTQGQQVIDQELLRRQIIGVLKDNQMEVVPDLRFRLESPPCLLVVSPREKIEYFDRVLLIPGLNIKEMEEIENSVEKLGYSALVVKIGGIGVAYPAIVSPQMDIKYIVNAVVEEWAHQSLALKQLGFLYLLDCLGYTQPAEVIEMNETLAGIIADEIGGQVLHEFYGNYAESTEKMLINNFDFDSEMRKTRLNVDIMLKKGDVAFAEQYMQERSLYFGQNGYNIRKLNQAYFAFHGIYGSDPGAVSTVYKDMKSLRRDYKTLAGFVNDISGMSSYAQLRESLRK